MQQTFDKATHDPRRAQADLLMSIIEHNQDTEYGRKHGFSRIKDGDEFVKAVPVNTFLDLSPYIEKMKDGQGRILSADKTVMFNVTSGTTDKPKFLPVTQRGWDLASATSCQWLSRALLDHPSFLDHSILLVSAALTEGETLSGIPYGSASGMLREGLPPILRRSLVLPVIVSKIKDYALRYYLMARLAIEQEISFIATPNPTTLIQIGEAAIRHQDEIISAIHDGLVFPKWPHELESGERLILNEIGASLRPNQPRAQFLESIIRQNGRLLLSACWSQLELIGCWLGGSVGFHAEKLSSYYGQDVSKRDIGYMASEGSMTIPYQDNTPAGILALDNNYYEFMPENEMGDPSAALLNCHEVELNKRYKVVLTNWNGLYRYDIGDIIEVLDFYNQTPVLAFVHKCNDMLNITGEKVHLNHLLKTFEGLKKQFNISVSQFRVVPNLEKMRYEILMHLAPELPEPIRELLRNEILPFIDKTLCEINIEYNDKRKSRRLLAPCIHLMSPSWEEEVRRHFVESGRRDIQYKWRATAKEISELDTLHIIETIQP